MIEAALAAAALMFAVDTPTPDMRVRVGQAPKRVASFIERRANCNHFTGEEAYDRERARELNRAIRELGCARLSRDEAKLRKSYQDNAAILGLLDETEELLGW